VIAFGPIIKTAILLFPHLSEQEQDEILSTLQAPKAAHFGLAFG